MRIWKREGYIVEEVELDHDLHQFEVKVGNDIVATIVPSDIDDMERIIEDLNAGEGVEGWEDGMGNTITIPVEEESK